MKKLLILLLAGMLFPVCTHAQDRSGAWSGKLALPTGSLTLRFNLQRSDAGYTATCDSPDQGAIGIPTESASFRDSVLTIRIPAIHASYEGKMEKDGRIYGTFTQGIALKLTLERGEQARLKCPQEPLPPYPYQAEEVTVENVRAGISLAGTLTLPGLGKPAPAVVLVSGSGPQNRDEQIMGHKPFLVIADYLTRRGIAVLRCDDRGVGRSKGDYSSATDADFADDAEAAFRYLKSRKEIDPKRIGIIGHSCGGTVAFMLAAKNPEVAFVVSLAGAAVRGDSLMLKQAERVMKSGGMPESAWSAMKPMLRARYTLLTRDKSVAAIRRDLQADIDRTLSPEQSADPATRKQIDAQADAMTSPWYLHFMRYDPTDDLTRTMCPVFAANGDMDVQVDAGMNLAAIERRVRSNGNKRVTVKEYPGLNHLFQTSKTGAVEEYGQLEETFSPRVLQDMTAWIVDVTGADR